MSAGHQCRFFSGWENQNVSERLKTSRRGFLKTSAAGLAVAPTIIPATALASADRPAPSDRVVVGCIGTGDLGRRHHLNNMLLPNKRIEVAAVCDVDQNRRDQAAVDVFNKTKKRVGIYEDFRDLCDRTDIDAVLIATPDHWHALTSLYAMESGKDVYCEKPLTLTIDEGKKLVATARQYGTVFQTGSQQRSDNRFRLACELVRNGYIGELKTVDTYINNVGSGEWKPVTTPPPELNWDFYVGPAPYRDYCPNRVHYDFRWFLDFSGGKLTDWGAHHNDIAQWGIGSDGSGPVKVSAQGKFSETGPFDVANEFDVTYTYGNGVVLTCHSQGENGVKFTGTNGWIFVSRGTIEASDRAILKSEFKSSDTRLYKSLHHHNNWLDCIQSRERPICDVEIGHRSCTICHLGNIALRLGRPLEWDPVKEDFVNDEYASRLVRKPMRAPWQV
jgi:predicted dehydrogenase